MLVCSPFVVFAGEGPVDKLADGSGIMYIIQDNHQWNFSGAGFPVNLIGQIGQAELEILFRGECEVMLLMYADIKSQTRNQMIAFCWS